MGARACLMGLNFSLELNDQPKSMYIEFGLEGQIAYIVASNSKIYIVNLSFLKRYRGHF